MTGIASLAPPFDTLAEVTRREEEPSLLGGMTGLLGGIGGGTPRPNGGFVADFLLPGLPPLNFSAAFGGLMVAMLVACCGWTAAAD